MGQENKKPTSPRGRDDAAGKSIRSDQARKRPENTTNEQMEVPEHDRKLGKRHD